MNPLLTDEEIAFLASLAESGVAYMVVGMSSAILQGVPGTTQDIDLWVRSGQSERLSEACKKAGGRFAWRASPPMVVGRGLEQFDLVWRCDGLGEFDEEARRAEVVELAPGLAVQVLPLDRVLVSKEASGRPKDLAVLPMLRDVLAQLSRER